MSSGGLGIIVAGAIGSSLSGANKTQSNRRIGNIVANVTIEEQHIDQLQISEHPVERGANVADHAFMRPAELTLRVSWSNSTSAPGSMLGNIAGALQNSAIGSLQNIVTGAAAKVIGGSALGNLAVAQLSNKLGQLGTAVSAQFNTGQGKGTSKVQDVYTSLRTLQRSAIPFDVYTGKRKYSNMVIRTLTVETDVTTENALMATLACQEVILVSTSVGPVNAPATAQKSPENTVAPEQAGTKQAELKDPTQNPALLKTLQNVIPAFTLPIL